jgi:hypothetical protein
MTTYQIEVLVFAAPSGQFYHDMKNPGHLEVLYRLDNYPLTRKLLPVYRDWQKPDDNLLV